VGTAYGSASVTIDDEERHSDEGRHSSLGRLARFPARVARGQVDEHLVPEVSRITDRALAGELPEHLARSVAEHHVIERIVEQLAESGALDAMVDRAVASPRTDEIVQRVVASPAVQQAIRDVVSSPEIVEALKAQTTGILDQLADDVSDRGNALDDRIESVVRRRPVTEPTYAGLATRGAAFALDLVAIAVIYALFAGTLALISYLVGGLARVSILGGILGGGATLLVVAYFVAFWNGAGRTPGMQLLGLRVRDASGGPPSFGRSLVRALVTWFSILIFFLGYVPVLFSRRRRSLPDLVAGTEVVYRPQPPAAS
jgi:uncharacterized RDD family membrane protein YckC